MSYWYDSVQDSYKICFLVNTINVEKIKKEYLSSLDVKDILVLDLPTKEKGKVTAKEYKEYWNTLKETFENYNIEYVVVCNGDAYKAFTKSPKAEVNLGYIKLVDNRKVLYVPDYKMVFYDPEKTRAKINRSISSLKDDMNGMYYPPGTIQYNSTYPKIPSEIKEELFKFLPCDKLTCDIETFSLRPHLAGIASIGFAKNQEEGIAFSVDLFADCPNEEIRDILREFFEKYQGALIFHNIAFDATVLTYQLYMSDITDTEGCLKGIRNLLKNFEDTKLIAYLATNSCAGNELGLKALAQEFAGNYAQEEIEHVEKIPETQLLEYNLKDCLSTWFVYNKYKPIMLKDNQEGIYKNLFLPCIKDIVQMQLTGFPLNMKRVLEVEQILKEDQQNALKGLENSSIIKNFIDVLKQEWVEQRNSVLKKKKVTLEDATKVTFNPRSHPQLQRLFYEELGLPVINMTAKCLPSTDSDTLKALQNHTDNEEIKNILGSLIDFYAVDKILTAFIPAFKDAVYSPKLDWHFLIGNFNLGGTVSGRLSSNRPNLQQLPATGTKYAKLMKSCFQAPKGWCLCGLDFNALEDHISALLTKDKNKLKVYTDGYDGHCLRANSYWPELMPDIQEQLNVLNKEGKIYKVTFDDGSIKYLHEDDPELKEFQNALY